MRVVQKSDQIINPLSGVHQQGQSHEMSDSLSCESSIITSTTSNSDDGSITSFAASHHFEKTSFLSPMDLDATDNESNICDRSASTRRKSLTRNRPGKWLMSSNHMMCNQERYNRNILPLTRLSQLDLLARQHADAMADKQELFHILPNLIRRHCDKKVLWLGENVKRGESVQAMQGAMMKNDIESRNILDRRFLYMGMATARSVDGKLYLCQIFCG